MSKDVILISVEAPEISIARLRDDKLINLKVERSGRLVGDVFRGVVRDVVPGMDAAFVDIGLERNALLYSGDVARPVDPIAGPQIKPIQQLVKPGDQLDVQVVRAPVRTKGARITGKIALSGRFAVVTMASENTGVSKRIDNNKERQRLRRIAQKVRPLDKSVIIRGEAQGASENDIRRDVNWLEKQLAAIQSAADKAAAPSVIYRELGLLGRLARDELNESIAQVLIDSQEHFEIFRNLVHTMTPHFSSLVHFYQDKLPLFERYNIVADIQLAQSRRVPLKHGGSLIIDENEALCTIDVNTAHFTGKKRLADTIFTTNMDAAEEAARQLRLRDIGGIIVIDFIDMYRNKDRIKVLSTLEDALKPDRLRSKIVQISPSGIVELSRQREAVSLRHLRYKNCPECHGEGMMASASTTAIEARRSLRSLAARGCQNAAVTLFPDAACAALKGPYLALLGKDTGMEIALRADAGMHRDARHIEKDKVLSIPQELKSGAKLSLSAHHRLYPETSPEYALCEGMMIRLESLEWSQDKPALPALIEITRIDNLSASARVLAYHKSQNES